ncbi:uncharacterized protein LOC144449355 [Glandiceps talaboti]
MGGKFSHICISLSIMADVNGSGDAGSVLDASGVINLSSIPNFRQVYPENRDKGNGKLYRSSRPDLICENDYEKLQELGIRSIVDCRSVSEYNRANGEKRLDEDFNIVAVKLPKTKASNGPIGYKPAKVKKNNNSAKIMKYDPSNPKKHFLIDFYSVNYIWSIFNRAPVHKRLISLIFLICDFLFRTDYFVRYYARNVLNVAGLVANYIDMIEMSSRQICAALKLLMEEDNLPAVINCAHGKDRTGIVSAIAQTVLGIPRDKVVKDYSLSQTLLLPVRERLYKEVVLRFQFAEDFINSQPETMEGVLDHINQKYGSMEGYLESIGFTKEDQLKLKKSMMAK